MRLVITILLCVCIFLVAPLPGYSQQKETVNSISFESIDKGSELITLKLSDAILPKIFKLSGENPRLVLDFLATTYKGKTRLDTQQGELVRGIRVGVHQKPELKTRIVVDLNKDREIFWSQDFKPDENLLVISIKGGGSISAKPLPVVLPPSTAKIKPTPEPQQIVVEVADEAKSQIKGTPDIESGQIQEIKSGPVLLDISFDNVYAKNGEMVLFKLNDFHPPTVTAIEKGLPRIVCDFNDASMHRNVKKEIDANGKLVDKIRVAQHNDPAKIRVVLDLLPGKDYDLQQVFFKEDNLFVLIVNTLGESDSNVSTSVH